MELSASASRVAKGSALTPQGEGPSAPLEAGQCRALGSLQSRLSSRAGRGHTLGTSRAMPRAPVFFSAPWNRCGTAGGDRPGRGWYRDKFLAWALVLDALTCGFAPSCSRAPSGKGRTPCTWCTLLDRPTLCRGFTSWPALFLYSVRMGPFLPGGLPPGAFLIGAGSGGGRGGL